MSWTAVRSWTVGSSGLSTGTTASASGTATAAGNSIVVGIVADFVTSWSTPSGWTSLIAITTGVPCALFLLPNWASISSLSYTLSTTSHWLMAVGEVSGGGSAPSLSGNNSSNTGSSVSIPTGTVTTSGTAVFGLCCDDTGTGTIANPTGSFTLWSNGSAGSRHAGIAMGLIYRLNVTSGSYSSTCDDNTGDPTTYSGLIAGVAVGSSSPTISNSNLQANRASVSFSGVETFPGTLGLQANRASTVFRMLDYPSTLAAQVGPASMTFQGVRTSTLFVTCNTSLAVGPVSVSLSGTESFAPTFAMAANRASLVVAAGIPPVIVMTASARQASLSFSATQGPQATFYLAASPVSIAFTVPTSANGTLSLQASSPSLRLTGLRRLGPLSLAASPASVSIQAKASASGNFAFQAGSVALALAIQGSTGPTGPYVYHVYLSTDLDNPVAEVAGLSWASPPLAASSTTTWVVHTYDPVTQLEDNATDTSVTVSVNSAYIDNSTLPLAPVNLSAQPKPAGTALVKWTFARNAARVNPTQFNVYIGTPAPDYTSHAAVVGFNPLTSYYSVTVYGLQDQVTYRVGVRSQNAAGEEGNSRTVSVIGCNESPEAPIIVSVGTDYGT